MLVATPLATAAPAMPASVPSKEEAELVRDADDIEKRLSSSGQLYGSATVDAYVQSVADAVRSPTDTTPLRARVVKSPWPNAYVLPNGAAYVTTAMLAMIDNEAQLACILGHETTHLAQHHALKATREQKVREGFLFALSMLAGVAGTYYTGYGDVGTLLANLTQSAGQLWMLSAISGYSRDYEREADALGFERFAAAGYATDEAPRVFETLLARTVDAGDKVRPYFASHPKLEERVASVKALAASHPVAGGRTEEARYAAALGELPLDQAESWLKSGDAVQAQRTVDRYLTRNPQSSRAHYLAGECWRQQPDRPDWFGNAVAEYERAAALPAPPPDALRQKGLLHRERGQAAESRAAFEKLLALDPQAVDAGLIRMYLQEMGTAPMP